METRLTFRYDREADILHIDKCLPYAAQESEELGDEVIAPGLDRLDAIAALVEGRDEDDRDAAGARIALEPATDFEAGRPIVHLQVARRHVDVENDERRLPGKRQVERRGPVVRDERAVA